jgi:hypothetical protein
MLHRPSHNPKPIAERAAPEAQGGYTVPRVLPAEPCRCTPAALATNQARRSTTCVLEALSKRGHQALQILHQPLEAVEIELLLAVA